MMIEQKQKENKMNTSDQIITLFCIVLIWVAILNLTNYTKKRMDKLEQKIEQIR